MGSLTVYEEKFIVKITVQFPELQSPIPTTTMLRVIKGDK